MWLPSMSKILVLVIFCIIIYVGGLVGALLAERYFDFFPGYPGEGGLILNHFAAVVGLPMIAALSLVIVLLLPQAYGRIEFKALGMSFKGASGPVILWVVCFITITLALKLVW
jgi:hypothetical protein